MRTSRFVLVFLGIMAAGIAQADQGRMLDGEAIRALVTGKRVYLAGPLGSELPLNYRANGEVDGSGEAIGLGRFFKPNDTGRWWIMGDQLCQQFKTWYDGTRLCFKIQMTGENTLTWHRDNGERGTARISRR